MNEIDKNFAIKYMVASLKYGSVEYKQHTVIGGYLVILFLYDDFDSPIRFKKENIAYVEIDEAKKIIIHGEEKQRKKEENELGWTKEDEINDNKIKARLV